MTRIRKMAGLAACVAAALVAVEMQSLLRDSGPRAWAQEQVPPPPPVVPDSAAAEKEGQAAEAETTLDDQTEVAVTVYNNNLALVRDRRSVSLPTGDVSLRFADVAQQIRPETVSLESIARPGSIAILEQNYEFDLISPSKLMEKYVGKPVRLISQDQDQRFTEVDAILLSVNEGPVYQIDDEIYLGHPGTVVLPEIPENLVARPSLIWQLQNGAPEQVIEATYLTGGVRWNADYVAKLGKDEDTMDLSGWVTLTNESGATYTDAKLKLVAGDVNIIQPPQPQRMMFDASRGMPMAAAEAAPMREEAFAEYHLYTLPRPTTIKQNQTKQVSLLTAPAVKVKKEYEFKGEQQYLFQIIPPVKDAKVSVYLKFQNEEESGLGMPLPAGVVRVYQEDSEGMWQFAGEDRIEHTARDEEVRVKIGQAFDVVGERTQTDFRRIADNVHQVAFEIKLRNHKDEPVTVDIVEPMTSDWTILQSSHLHTKKDAFTAVFTVEVPADGETVVTYRAQVRF